MEDIVLKVENMSKQYRLGEIGTGTLQHDLNRWWHKVRGKEDPYLKIGEKNDRASEGGEYVWALHDINFEVKQGEVLGIIGKNGAGKSTLLKILSQITGPTTGSMAAKGRIASLLEVGTGMHHELTGRENIFLNGAILGMSKAEVKNKFDEIVDFSGCAKYIDTPVKRYSSGMMVRLGFAVAAFLEPEILIVDEVLAVGDAEFQQNCIGKMKDVSQGGRTVLFVSHNMASIKSLCHRGILLDQGTIDFDGSVTDCVERYLDMSLKVDDQGFVPESASTINTGLVKVSQIKMFDHDGRPTTKIPYKGRMVLEMAVDSKENLENLLFDVRICNTDGIQLIHSMNQYESQSVSSLSAGENRFKCTIQNQLQPGKYNMTIGVHKSDGATLDFLEHVVDFDVLEVASDSNDGFAYTFQLGFMRAESKWEKIS